MIKMKASKLRQVSLQVTPLRQAVVNLRSIGEDTFVMTETKNAIEGEATFGEIDVVSIEMLTKNALRGISKENAEPGDRRSPIAIIIAS
jgi:hypothetical protein